MGSKKETKTTNTYNQPSMNTFNTLQTPIQNTLTDYMKDPLTASYFNQNLQMALGQQQKINQRGMQNLFQRGQMMGTANNSGAMQQLAAAQDRANSASESNIFLNGLFDAENRRMAASGQAMNYKPLQTGQESVEKTSGLGTWLPQVVGAGLGVATGIMTGGASMAAQAGSLGGKIAATGAGIASNIGGNLWGNPFSTSYASQPYMGGSFSRSFVAQPSSYSNLFGPGFRG
jgi:hypothetical protein